MSIGGAEPPRKALQRGEAHLIIVYGRRRVGKTRLLLELLSRRSGPYFYVPLGEEDTVLAELSRAVESEFFKGFRSQTLPFFGVHCWEA